MPTETWNRLPQPRRDAVLTAAEAEFAAHGFSRGSLNVRSEGLVQAPLFIQTCFGLLGGIGSHPEEVLHMKRTADRLFCENYRWSVLAAGQGQMRVAAMAAAMGGHVRVGLEDSLWLGRGQLAESNAAQVIKVRQIIEGLGLEIATPDDAREILSLKGGDKVNF